MRCNNEELNYGPAISVGHYFRRSMRSWLCQTQPKIGITGK